MSFVAEYAKLLIQQYYYKPKARAEIEAKAGRYLNLYESLNRLLDVYDIDKARNIELDLIGKIVGVSRSIPDAIAKEYFGFDGYPLTKAFLVRGQVSDAGAFRDAFKPNRSSLELEDEEYRFLIRAKIAKNTCQGFLFTDDKKGIRDIIYQLFNNEAQVIDNRDMTLTLNVSSAVNQIRLQILEALDLLPRPQGVRFIIQQA